MKRIGLLSDTHGNISGRLLGFFEKTDELWHAGDIGNAGTLNMLASFKPLKAVYGNIDGPDIRISCPQHHRFFCEEVNVWITHIGGYPGNYDRSIRPALLKEPPDLFVCGHSHILRVIYDHKLDLLHINPGAAGNTGFHKFKTAIRFVIDGKEIRELEIWESERLAAY